MSEQLETRKVPKINAGGISKTALFWGLAAVIMLGGTAGAGAYYKYVYKKSPEAVTLRQHTGQIEAADWLFEPEPEPVKPEPEPEPEPVKEPEPEPVMEAPAPRPRLFAADLFTTVPPVDTNQAEIAAMNDARRGAVGIKSPRDLYGTVSKDDYTMSQEVWDEEQIITPFPIDMTRVVPVYMNIPATLINEINSEQPGKVVAQVNQHIYGGHGRKVLIPAGSMATGYYAPLEKAGQERLVITWVRIDTPSGINIHTANAEMADAMGRAGITGEIDNKYFERYGLGLFVTTIQAAAAYAVPVESRGQQVLMESYGSSVSSMGQRILDENIQIKPTVTIKAGEQILISPMKDIWFPKPIKRTIQAVAVED